MKDIHEVLRQKQTKYALLGKQIEMLQQAAEKLREVAPLLAENDDEDNAVLMEATSFPGRCHGAGAGAGSGSIQGGGPRRPVGHKSRRSEAGNLVMTLLALLVSTDDSASEILGRVLPACGIAVERFSDLATAIERLQQQRFDALIVDFEDAKAAAEVIEEARRLNSGTSPRHRRLGCGTCTKARDILSGGAHFVLYKPTLRGKSQSGSARSDRFVESRTSPRLPGSGAGSGGTHAAG
jgi:hypothetical protein